MLSWVRHVASSLVRLHNRGRRDQDVVQKITLRDKWFICVCPLCLDRLLSYFVLAKGALNFQIVTENDFPNVECAFFRMSGKNHSERQLMSICMPWVSTAIHSSFVFSLSLLLIFSYSLSSGKHKTVVLKDTMVQKIWSFYVCPGTKIVMRKRKLLLTFFFPKETRKNARCTRISWCHPPPNISVCASTRMVTRKVSL